MKKIHILLGGVLFFTIVPHALAQGFVALAPIPGLTQGVTADANGLAAFFNNLYKYLIGLAAVIAIIEIIWGGLEISTKDSVSAHSNGKERIQQAIFGLVLVLSPVLVFSIINPSILNLSLNLPKLDTASGGAASNQTSSGTLNSVATSSLNAIYVGQLVGFGDNYYPDTTVGAYCFPIDPIVRNGAEVRYGCSADPTRCLTMSNGSNGAGGVPKSQLSPGTQCTKY